MILTLGKCAVEALTGSKEGITRLRGKWTLYNNIPMMPSFHPSFLLRNSIQKKFSWHDFLSIQQKLSTLGFGTNAMIDLIAAKLTNNNNLQGQNKQITFAIIKTI